MTSYICISIGCFGVNVMLVKSMFFSVQTFHVKYI